MGAYEAIVSRNVGEDGEVCSETVYCLTDRPLEKIDERHTESESEAEKELFPPTEIQIKEELIIPMILEPIEEVTDVPEQPEETETVDEQARGPFPALMTHFFFKDNPYFFGNM